MELKGSGCVTAGGFLGSHVVEAGGRGVGVFVPRKRIMI